MGRRIDGWCRKDEGNGLEDKKKTLPSPFKGVCTDGICIHHTWVSKVWTFY